MAARFPWRKQPKFSVYCIGTRNLISNLIMAGVVYTQMVKLNMLTLIGIVDFNICVCVV